MNEGARARDASQPLPLARDRSRPRLHARAAPRRASLSRATLSLALGALVELIMRQARYRAADCSPRLGALINRVPLLALHASKPKMAPFRCIGADRRRARASEVGALSRAPDSNFRRPSFASTVDSDGRTTSGVTARVSSTRLAPKLENLGADPDRPSGLPLLCCCSAAAYGPWRPQPC